VIRCLLATDKQQWSQFNPTTIGENPMSKVELATSERDLSGSELQDKELDGVSGGFGFVERSFGLILPAQRILPPSPCLPPDPCRSLIG
jgi:hypothetical protein